MLAASPSHMLSATGVMTRRTKRTTAKGGARIAKEQRHCQLGKVNADFEHVQNTVLSSAHQGAKKGPLRKKMPRPVRGEELDASLAGLASLMHESRAVE